MERNHHYATFRKSFSNGAYLDKLLTEEEAKRATVRDTDSSTDEPTPRLALENFMFSLEPKDM